MQDKSLKLKCAIYTRVSTDSQAEVEFNSCEAQEAKIRSFIDSQENMEIFRAYSDPGFTGANLNRPAMQAILEDVKQKKIDLVISYKIDRLTRSPRDFYQLIELFDKYGVDFISVTERFDTSTPSGRLLRNIMLTFAQFERELISERTRDKMLERAQRGMWNGAKPSFGYKAENKKLVVDKDKVEIVRSIYEKYITGSFVTTIAKETDLPKNKIFLILRNPVYIGKLRYAGKISQGIHKPIISDDVFNFAQSLHKQKIVKMKVYKNYSLAGLIKCKECGSTMTPCFTNKRKENKLKRYYYYRCTKIVKKDWQSCMTKEVSADRIERYIFDNLERIAIDKQYLESLIFTLNSGVLGAHSGVELPSDPLTISPEIVAQTLTHLTKTLPQKRGIDKNLFIKKFIKNIIYSPSQIQINLNYFKDFSANSIEISPDRGLRPLTASPKGLPPTLLACPVGNCNKIKPVSINNKSFVNPQHVQRDEKFSDGVNDFLFGGGGDLFSTVLTAEEASAKEEKNGDKIRSEFSRCSPEQQVRDITNGVADGTRTRGNKIHNLVL